MVSEIWCPKHGIRNIGQKDATQPFMSGILPFELMRPKIQLFIYKTKAINTRMTRHAHTLIARPFGAALLCELLLLSSL